MKIENFGADGRTLFNPMVLLSPERSAQGTSYALNALNALRGGENSEVQHEKQLTAKFAGNAIYALSTH